MKNLLLSLLIILPLAGCYSGSSDRDGDSTEYGDVMLYWSEPTARANGESLATAEIGGYEVRYRLDSDDSYTVKTVGSEVTQLLLENIPSPDEQIIEMAVFDTDGIYSDYVKAMAN